MRRLLVLLALVALVSLACGTAKINLHTIVRSSGDTTQEVNIEATGLLANSMKESSDPEKAKAEGWTVTSEEKEDSFSTKMSRTFKRDEMLRTPFGEAKEEGAPTLAQPQASFKINDSLIAREYEFRIKLAGSQAEQPNAEADKATQELMQSLTGDVFKVSWSITLPGEIVETNADSKTATTATWNFGFDTLAKEREMVVKSRETNYTTIGGAAAAVVVVVIVVVILLLRRRSPSAPAAPEAPAAPAAPASSA